MYSPYLSIEEVRKAVAYGIDKERLKKEIFKGYAEVLKGFIPKYHWAYDKGIEEYSYLPHKSRAFLKYVGFDTTVLLKFITLDDSIYVLITDYIKEDLKKIGIKIKPIYLSPSSYYKELKNRNFDMALLSWKVNFALEPLELWYSSPDTGIFNFAGFRDGKADSLLLTAFSSFNWQRTKHIWREFQRILIEKCPAVFLLNPYRVIIKRKELHSIGEYMLADAWGFWLEKKMKRRYEDVTRVVFFQSTPESTVTEVVKESIAVKKKVSASPVFDEILEKEREKREEKDTTKKILSFVRKEVKYTPPQVVYIAKPKYPEILREVGIEGVIIVEVKIDEKGDVISAKVVESFGNKLCESEALEAAKRCKFKPAKMGDRPVVSTVKIPYRFVP